jgi:hypothetical protein
MKQSAANHTTAISGDLFETSESWVLTALAYKRREFTESELNLRHIASWLVP